MIRRIKSLVTSALLVTLLGALSVPLFAQHMHGGGRGPEKQPGMNKQDKQQGMMKVGKTGEMTLTSPMRVAQTVLQPGTYTFQHMIEGADHVIVFKKNGEDVVRVTCNLEPLDKKAKSTALYTHAGDAGEVILDAVAVRGENVKHVL